MSAVRYFFDLPVYRLNESKYYGQRDHWLDQAMYPPGDPYSAARREMTKKDPNSDIGLRDHLIKVYGGCWRYNEIIGYIRLHFLGSQIRGEYYGVSKKKIVRTRRKTFEYRTWKLAAEIGIPPDSTSADIYQLIVEYVGRCRCELKERFIDTSTLEAISKHVDWRGLWLSD